MPSVWSSDQVGGNIGLPAYIAVLLVGHHSNMVSQNTHNTVHLLGSFLIAFLLILIIGLVACVFFLYGRQKEIESQRECGFSIPR